MENNEDDSKIKTEREKQRLYERGAYHECGHVIFTYFTGYTCDWVDLIIDEPGSGRSSLNYGTDLLLITGIINCINEDHIYNSLENKQKSRTLGVANKITSILLSGSVAEYVFLNGGKVDNNMKIEISGPDLERVDNVHFLLAQLIPERHPINYIQQEFQRVLGIIRNVRIFWLTIDILAKKLLESSSKKLIQIEIEAVLQKCGYLEYLKTLPR